MFVSVLNFIATHTDIQRNNPIFLFICPFAIATIARGRFCNVFRAFIIIIILIIIFMYAPVFLACPTQTRTIVGCFNFFALFASSHYSNLIRPQVLDGGSFTSRTSQTPCT